MQNRCGYCYNLGHNRRTCPGLTKALEKGAAAGNEYQASQLAARGKGRAGAHRTCSFCGNQGHDRRTCGDIQEFVRKDSSKIFEARIDFIEKMKDSGFGVGALVSLKHRTWDTNSAGYKDLNQVGIVTKILWDQLTHRTYNSPDNVVEIHSFNSGVYGKGFYSLPYNILSKGDEHADSYWVERCPKILNPVNEFEDPPNDFLLVKKCAKISKEFTQGKKSWSWEIQNETG